MAAEERPRRLCSEIQLFDLCGKEKCAEREGRFCTDENMLNRFEAISQEEDFPPDQYLEDEQADEGEEEGGYSDFGDGFEDDGDEENEEY